MCKIFSYIMGYGYGFLGAHCQCIIVKKKNFSLKHSLCSLRTVEDIGVA